VQQQFCTNRQLVYDERRRTSALEDWLGKARKTFPELAELINTNQSGPLGLWSDLYVELEKAYEAHPMNEDLIARIYNYAAWCFRQPETGDIATDLSSATAVGLIESIPLNKLVSADLYRWMSQESFDGCEKLFRCHLSDQEYNDFSAEFLRKKKSYSGVPTL
jgi:hypothetical protein